MQQMQYSGGGVGMKRQATWDALPDIDFFSIPVDDFFETYVEELGARGSGLPPEAAPLDGTPLTSGELDPVLEHFPHTGTQQMDGLMTPAVAQAAHQSHSFPSAGGVPFQNGMPPVPLEPFQNGMPPVPLEPLQPMANLVTSGFEAPVHQRSGSGSQGSGNWGPAANNRGSGNFSNEESPEDGDDDSTPNARTGNKRQAKPKRNARQQDQNKQAQQRYRERRKQKFQEMEQALEQLSSQVQDMQAVQSKNAMLQGKAQELEGKLQQKELEIEALRQALAKSGADQSVLNLPVEKMEYAAIKPAECDKYREHKERRREEETARLQREWAACTDDLRAFVDQHNLRHVDPSGAGVAREIVERVRDLVTQGCQLCQSAMRAEGIKVLALMSRDVAQMAHIECHIERAKWERILDVLRLTEPQSEQLLELRKVHLRNLRSLFEDRQRLNLQAMSLMLPKNVGRRQIPDASTLESRMDTMRITSSYSCAALNNVHLDSILDDIKCNLRKEQRTVMELNYMTMHKVLTPIQSGLFVVEAFPGHPDCLALGNILAKRRGGEPLLDCQPTSSEEKSETCSLGAI